jgi:hypothetical protein
MLDTLPDATAKGRTMLTALAVLSVVLQGVEIVIAWRRSNRSDKNG